MKYAELLKNWLDAIEYSIVDVPSSGEVVQVNVEGRTYYLKRKKSEDEVRREVLLSGILRERDVPVPAPLTGKNRFPWLHSQDQIYALYEALPGRPVGETAPEHAEAIGQAIARLHEGLRTISGKEAHVPRMDLRAQLLDWAFPRSLAFDLRTTEASVYIRDRLLPILDDLPQQVIHRDPNPSNILFKDGAFSGFVDFDLATYGLRAFDPCYCSTGMLMAGFHDADERTRWFAVCRKLLRGYHRANPFTPSETRSLFPVMLAIMFIFIAYFRDTAEDLALQNVEGLLWLYENLAVFEPDLAGLSSNRIDHL